MDDKPSPNGCPDHAHRPENPARIDEPALDGCAHRHSTQKQHTPPPG